MDRMGWEELVVGRIYRKRKNNLVKFGHMRAMTVTKLR